MSCVRQSGRSSSWERACVDERGRWTGVDTPQQQLYRKHGIHNYLSPPPMSHHQTSAANERSCSCCREHPCSIHRRVALTLLLSAVCVVRHLLRRVKQDRSSASVVCHIFWHPLEVGGGLKVLEVRKRHTRKRWRGDKCTSLRRWGII